MKPYAKKILGESLSSDTDLSDTDWCQSDSDTDSDSDSDFSQISYGAK